MITWRGQDSKWRTPIFTNRHECAQWMRTYLTIGSNPAFPNLNHLISLCVGKEQLYNRLFVRQLLFKRSKPHYLTESDLENNRFFPLRFKLYANETTALVNHVTDSTVTAPDSTVTAPNSTVSAMDSSVSAMDSTVCAPDSTVCAPDSSVYDTTMYLYNEMRCGVFVKIVNQQLVMFTPFVNPDYTNRWSSLSLPINVDEYYCHKAATTRRPVSKIDLPVNKWWANSYVVCNEPTSDIWGDANLSQLRHMLESVCIFRDVPDVEFFVNKRDIPQVRKDGRHPQSFMFPEGTCPLVYSPSSTLLLPVASGYVGDEFCDVAFPLPVDWERACMGQVFPPNASYADVFPNLPWELRMNRACFRGSCTGGGTTPHTNQRLKLVLLARVLRAGLLDAELTGWNLRDKKMSSHSPMGFIVPSDYPSISAGKHNYMPMAQQCHFKYAVYVDGHSAANRYGGMMAAEFVILRVKSISTLSNKLWFYPLLEDGVDHISVAADLSDLAEKLEWCVANDVAAREIAKCARLKWEQFMQKDGIMDFVQLALYKMSRPLNVKPILFWENVVLTPKSVFLPPSF